MSDLRCPFQPLVRRRLLDDFRLSAEVVTRCSPGLFQRLTRGRPRSHQASGDGAGVRERSHNPIHSMASYPMSVIASAIGISAVLWSMAGLMAPATAAPRCPDQQMSESGPFQGRICRYGDWEVSRALPYGYRY